MPEVRNKARVLPRGHALSRPPGARKQKFVTFLPGQLQIGINGVAGVVGQFEPDGTSSLFLTHRPPGDRMPIGSNLFDLERNDIASPQLAIDSKIEQCQFEDPPLDVEFGPDRPDVFGPERRLGPDDLAFIPRCAFRRRLNRAFMGLHGRAPHFLM